jgi:hypothetical protein
MKYTFEETDNLCGLLVKSSTTAANNRQIIIYDSRVRPGEGRYGMVCLCDGMLFRSGKTAAEMVKMLNEGGYRPTQHSPNALRAVLGRTVRFTDDDGAE